MPRHDAPLPDPLTAQAVDALIARATRRPTSHVALQVAARRWDAEGGDPGRTRRLLEAAEAAARRHGVDYSGAYDDFEEEDSWLGVLANDVATLLDEAPWAARLVEEGIATDPYAERLADTLSALNRLPTTLAEVAVTRGVRARLEAADPELLAPLQPLIYVMEQLGVDPARRLDVFEVATGLLCDRLDDVDFLDDLTYLAPALEELGSLASILGEHVKEPTLRRRLEVGHARVRDHAALRRVELIALEDEEDF